MLDLDGRRLLIDLGVSAFILKQALIENGYGFDAIDAVLITHTHSDHVRAWQSA